METGIRGLNKISIPKYTLSEELINSITHGIGAALSIVFLVLCIIRSVEHHNIYSLVSSTIYASSSIILYLMSCLYHAFKVNRAKKLFRIFDHCTIYLLIAGTYTPFALVALRSASPILGWSIFGIIWACAIVGIVFTAINMNKFKVMGMILYLIMGWLILFAFKTVYKVIPLTGIFYLFIAGLVYTIGALLYGLGKQTKYMHSIFHLFVVIASILFFLSIYNYVI